MCISSTHKYKIFIIAVFFKGIHIAIIASIQKTMNQIFIWLVKLLIIMWCDHHETAMWLIITFKISTATL